MKQLATLMLVIVLMLGSSSVEARDEVQNFSIADALERGANEGVVVSSIKLYFGDQEHPAVEDNHGEFTSNKKTNAFGKSDKKACQWAFLSAIKSLQERAIQEGGNAVINIYSYYKKNELVSETEFNCGAGNTVAGVTMIGEVVTLAE